MVRKLPLSNGGFTLVDDEVADELSKFKWRKHISGYACFGVRPKGKKYKLVLLHRVINKTPDGMFTDHINGHKLDNRRSNLRNASIQQNNRHSKKYKSGITSKFKGVCLRKDRGTWLAIITINGRRKKLGTFRDEIQAALAYDKAAIDCFREFALLNFPNVAGIPTPPRSDVNLKIGP